MPLQNKNIIFLHGTGQSSLSYNFLDVFLPEHRVHCHEYNVQDDIHGIANDAYQFYLDNMFSQPVSIVAHSYGCLIGILLAEKIKQIEHFIALSAPWGGSRTAGWLSMVFRQSKLFANTKPGSDLITSFANITNNYPITNVITTGSASSGNALAGFGSSDNDGMLTVETQCAYPKSFKNVTNIKLPLSHNEILLSMDTVDIIRGVIFDHDKPKHNVE